MFEHTPTIAEAAWIQRLFHSLEHLHQVMGVVVQDMTAEAQLNLIWALMTDSVDYSFINGKKVVDQGRLTTVELAQLVERTHQLSQQILA